jgi:uroporphyrinogen-III synthase
LKLLVTRPDPDAERTAAALRAHGHDVLLTPLMRIQRLRPDLGPGPWTAVLITSANAIRALELHPRREELMRLPVLAVGTATAEAARRAGLVDVTVAKGTAKDLVALTAARYGGEARLLYLAGADRSGDLVGDLAALGVPVEMRVVYQAIAQANLSAEAAAGLREGVIDGVLHFSRRSASFYLDAAASAGLVREALKPVQFCLSARIAEKLIAAGAETIRTAARPTERSLLRLIDSA